MTRSTYQPQLPESPQISLVVLDAGAHCSELSELVTCLQAQTYDNFEVLLVPHDVDLETLDQITTTVDVFAPRISRRIHVISPSPISLTRIVERTAGEQIVFALESDLLFNDWAERIAESHRHDRPCLVKTYTLEQPWERFASCYGPANRAVGSPATDGCSPYRMPSDILRRPFSPNVAFSRGLLEASGSIADRKLDYAGWKALVDPALTQQAIVDAKSPCTLVRLWTDSSQPHEWRRYQPPTDKASAYRKLYRRLGAAVRKLLAVRKR